MLEQPVGILGFGVEGKSTFNFLQAKGITNIKIFDKKNGANYLKGLSYCKTIIRSAGVYPLQKEIFAAQMKRAVLTSQVELFFDIINRDFPNITIIGVTGTLGKGSCVSMIEHCLKSLNIPCRICGNFGIPVLDLLEQKDFLSNEKSIIILELSSFQLMTLGVSPHIGVVLQTTSEHLDWHSSVEQYRDAKANLVRYQKRDDFCVYNANSEAATQIAALSSGIKKPFTKLNLPIEDFNVKGEHQLQNMAAAIQALECAGIAKEPCIEALKSYKGLDFRLQNVGTKIFNNKNITFYNDSYSTRPEATIAAIKAMDKPFVLILGGSEKHADFIELSIEISKSSLLKGVALIGNTAERLYNICKSDSLSMQIFENMQIAFEWCLEIVPSNGAVLLSPACASFGLFTSYKERGEIFNKLVLNLV